MTPGPAARRLAAGLLAGAIALPAIAATLASGPPAVPRFAIAPSPIGLTGDARTRQYLGVLGRRAAWLGTEQGEAELWVHPLKLATGFRLDFRLPGLADLLRGDDLARTVDVRPELSTITYSHETFTLRQHVLAPLDEPGLLVLLEVDAARPFDVVVSFQAAFQYAWPGAFGGQYATWLAGDRAFLLSESLRRHNAFIGSPWAEAASDPPAHALPDAPSRFSIPIDPARTRGELVPIAIAAGMTSRPDVLERYHRLLGQAEALYRQKRAHVDALRRSTVSVASPDPRLDLAFEWARVNLDEQMVCNPDLGCGLVAGWGPSGRSTRPGFGWFFGGDAAVNSLAMSALGMLSDVATGLRFLAKYQRDDGKIPHEISQSAGRLSWFAEYPYAYYHADTTPFWIVATARYWLASGDRPLLEELWPRLRSAYAWCKSHDTDGDGLIENTTGGLGAIEVGEIGADIHQDIYLAAVWIEALRAMRVLAAAMGDAATAEDAAGLGRRAGSALNEKYWLPASGHHAFGILRSGGTNEALTVWPATAAAFGALDRDRALRTLARLAGPAMSTDWGARTLASDHRLYDPTHYNMGAVWPFVTGFVALGHYRYGRPWAGHPLVHALSRMPFDWARGRHPELLSGDYYRPIDTAVPQQFFATSMLVTSLLEGMAGWRADAPAGRARLAPSLPPDWARVTFTGLPAGSRRLDARFERGRASLDVRLAAQGGVLGVDYAPHLPAGASLVAVSVDGQRVEPTRDDAAGTSGAEVFVPVTVSAEGTTVRVTWRGGLEPAPVLPDLRPGDVPGGARLVDFVWAEDRWRLAVEGRPGERCDIRLHGSADLDIRGAEVVERGESSALIRVTLPASAAATTTRQIEILPTARH